MARQVGVDSYFADLLPEDKVAQIATFGTMASKAAVRDAARVLEVPYAEADAVSKLIPIVFGRSTPIQRAMDEVSEIRTLYVHPSALFFGAGAETPFQRWPECRVLEVSPLLRELVAHLAALQPCEAALPISASTAWSGWQRSRSATAARWCAR